MTRGRAAALATGCAIALAAAHPAARAGGAAVHGGGGAAAQGGGAAAARAAGPLDLEVRRMPHPAPSSLVMRRARLPQAGGGGASAGGAARGAGDSAGGAAAARARPRAGAQVRGEPAVRLARGGDRSELAGPARRLEDAVIFRVTLGFGMDGGQPSGEPPAIGGQLDRTSEYAPLRPYGFGDVVLGTRGLLIPSLATYFASEFRVDQTDKLRGTPESGGAFTGAIPSVYYADDDPAKLLIRTGYAEVDGVFEHPALRPLYLRAGRQFKYGVAVAHFDGAAIGYDTRPLSLSLWGGSRVSLYGFDRALDRSPPSIVGGSARLDLFELRRVPLVLTYDVLRHEDLGHQELGLALRWNPDVLIRASARRLGDHFARQSLAVWARLSEVTTLNVELDNRTEYDWLYDLMALRPSDRPGDPRRYLNIGPPLPRLMLDARAGTVILRNLDVLVRGAAALEHAGDEEDGAFSPSYLEAGAALEVRLRRNIRLGSSFTARRYGREPPEPAADTPGAPDGLPALTGDMGELSFYEGGLGIDYTAGARRFSASAELYSRAYERQTPYPQVLVEGFDVHSGGRFSVEGWALSRVRIKAEYDVSLGPLETAPELFGVKMLRVLTEGTF